MLRVVISVNTPIQIDSGTSTTCNLAPTLSNLNGNSALNFLAPKTLLVPTIAAYSYNRVTEAMIGRGTTTRNKRSSSDKSDSASSHADKDSSGEGEIKSPKEIKRRRRLIEEDDQDNRDSASPSSPDHTYTSGCEVNTSDLEREWDMGLDNMLPCRGTEELYSSDEDADEDNDDDDDNNDDDDDDDDGYVVPGNKHATISSELHTLSRDSYE